MAAASLFLEKGFDGTSMDEVARRAGVSKQTVYSHFSSKDDLFSAAIRARIDVSLPEDLFDNQQHLPLMDALTSVATHFADLLLSEETIAIFRLLTSSAAKGPHLAELFFKSGADELSNRLEKFLDGRIKSGELDITNTQLAATQFINLLKGEIHFCWAIGLIDSIDDATMKTQIDDTVEAFIRMYGT